MMLVMVVALAGLVCATPKETKEVKMVREPAVAGQFYPDDGKLLAQMIDSMIKVANPPVMKGKVIGVQVPHAGIEYSGLTAAFGYKLLKGMEGVTVVMFGPSHRAEFKGAAVFSKGVWRTPLGDVPVDEKLAQEIIKEDGYFVSLPQVHFQEHSLEVQLPFLQRVLNDFKIVPIMLLFPSYEECVRVGKAVARAVKNKPVVLLASSDLYHGYSYTEAKQTDSFTLGIMERFAPEEFYRSLTRGYAEDRPLACGGYPIVAMMIAAREMGADSALVLYRTNSNDVLNQRGGYCVGYSAVAFLQSAGENKKDAEDLTPEEQQSLLGIARRTVEQYVRTGRAPEVTPLTERLKEKRGVFVTLHKHGELRGCIGYVEGVKPLYLATRDMAIAAATEDPRFPPVTAEELPLIDVEITVLSPLKRIFNPDSVIVGKHGLVIRKGFYSGLLLPQVPVEQGWNREEFLEYTCRKAGLPPKAYKEADAELYVFTGQVFGEKKRLGEER